MEEKVTFCEECRKDVVYSVESTSMTRVLKGEEYHFIGLKAVCTECNSEVYVGDIEDGNLKKLYDAYRRKNGIISLEEILEIPKKYSIGKRPLSSLLGWGEVTFTRYCEGYIPTKQYSDLLRKIYEDPSFYLSLLEKNKERLSPNAYEKSKRATMKLLGRHESEGSKIDHVVNYLLFRCEDITHLALQKVLYYIQGFHYAFTGSFLFDEDCEAWRHGPVYRKVYYRFAEHSFNPIKENVECDASVFTNMEKEIIDSVIQNFCCYSAKVLEKFTHSENPWLKARGDLPSNASSTSIINKEDIGEYFTAVKKKYEMLTPSDIANYVQVLFKRIAGSIWS